MANDDKTKLTCNDMQRFSEIMKSKWNDELKKRHEVKIDGDGVVNVESRGELPCDTIKQMSLENPDLIFNAEYSYESDWYCTVYVYRYKCGKEKILCQRINYMRNWDESDAHGYIKEVIGDHYEKLMSKAEEIFSRIDIIEKDGKKRVDPYGNEVVLTVEDEEYRLKLRKVITEIEIIECHKKKEVITYAWAPVVDPVAERKAEKILASYLP